MMKILKRQSSYIYIIIFNIIMHSMYKDVETYFGIKYFASITFVLWSLYSIVYSFLYFKVFLDNYYYIVLYRYPIITRIGRRKYYLLISKQVILHCLFLTILSILLDYLLVHKISIILSILNVLLYAFFIIILPKRKEYENELIIIMILTIIIKIFLSKYLLFFI